jgi:hypothetical protein
VKFFAYPGTLRKGVLGSDHWILGLKESWENFVVVVFFDKL